MSSEIRMRVVEDEPVRMSYVEAKLKPEQSKTVTPTDEGLTVLPDEGSVLSSVVVNPIPEATEDIDITANGDHDVRKKRTAHVQVLPALESKIVTPSEQAQVVTADQGYDGLGEVLVEPIPGQYIIPAGSQTFNADGTYDVTELAQAVVKTSPEKGVMFTDYDEDGFPHGLTFVGISNIPNMYVQRNVSDNNSLLSRITAITMDDSVTAIGNQAFERTNIIEIDFPASVTTWGGYIVRYCASLTKCTFRGNVNMGYYFFMNCTSMEEVHFGGNITSWNAPNFPNTMRLYDFSGCSTIPALGNVSWIGYGAGTVIKVPSAMLTQWQTETNWCDLPTDTTAERYVVWEGI